MNKDEAAQWLRNRRGVVLWRARHVPENPLGFTDEDEPPSYTVSCCAIGLLIVMMVYRHDDDTVSMYTASEPSAIDEFVRDNDVFSLGGGVARVAE